MCEPCREDRRAAKRATPCRAPGEGPLRPMRNPRARRQGLLRALRRDPLQAAEPQGEAGGRPPALCRTARPGGLHIMRQAGPWGGRVPGLLRGRAHPLRRPTGRRGLRQVQDAHLWRRHLLRPLRRCQGGTPRPRGGIRRQARPAMPNGGPGAAASSAVRRRRGVARCEPCSRRHRESSGAYRGIPVWDPTWTVIEVATGRDLGTFDNEAEIALCLAFEKLSREQVEVLCDASLMSSLTAPPW